MVKQRRYRFVAAMWVAAAIGGCARAATPIAVPMKVSVPIPEPVYCAAAAPPRPALQIASLNPDSAPADTIRAYAASVVVLKAAVAERDELLRACAAPQAQGKHPGEISQ
ncbi:MAG: hypothetical protein WAU33_00270 [Candidatus Binataceae bacterium]|jgi:hypothetical protein